MPAQRSVPRLSARSASIFALFAAGLAPACTENASVRNAAATGGTASGATAAGASAVGGNPSSAGASTAGGGVASGGTSAMGGAGGMGGATPIHPTCPGDAENAYQATAVTLSGTIEAENFDPAGYSDATVGNEGGAYRTDVDVDIKTLGAGHAVGWMTAGEWLEFTVDVPVEGDYDVALVGGAVEAGRTVQLSQCRTSLSGAIGLPQVDAWGTVLATPPVSVHLSAGLQVLRLTMGANDWADLDSITFELTREGSGGMGGEGGSPPTCDLPTSFSWTSSQPLISPKSPQNKNFVSIKDPTIVQYDGAYHVFATVFDTTQGAKGGWNSVYLTFSDWSQANSAEQVYMATLPTGGTVAPQVFYFAPHAKWYLIYQWGARYSTNDDIANPQGWTTPKSLLSGEPSGSLDYWLICDDENCHLFFARDDGTLYRSKVAKSDFPNFSGYEVVMSDTVANLFEAPNVYKVDGTDKYLLMVEAYGPRYFRSWTSESLDGPWTPLAATKQAPFAGAANVTFEGADWSDDVSHGELIRSGYDETLTINACNLQFLYQGLDPASAGVDYGLLPYRLGLLTAN